MKEFVKSLISSCQKANNIAVCCRREPELLSLLTQEKVGGEKNSKFDHDFKTLADVLIQETVRFELSQLSSSLGSRIHGEESNVFTNSLGQTTTLELNGCRDTTRDLLLQVLNGNEKVSSLLADEVHREVVLSNEMLENIEQLENTDFDISGVGVWIDPIDGTSQYIKGKEVLLDGYPVQGLQVAKVLIGVYSLETGRSLMGVVGSPFSSNVGEQLVFGSTVGERMVLFPSVGKSTSGTLTEETDSCKPRLVVGSSENQLLLDQLEKTFQVVRAGGAGHKMMMVLDGQVQLYINSSPSVYLWDTCAPHALLAALGGGVKTFKGFQDVVYNCSAEEGTAHAHGIVVYSSQKYLDLLQSKIIKMNLEVVRGLNPILYN